MCCNLIFVSEMLKNYFGLGLKIILLLCLFVQTTLAQLFFGNRMQFTQLSIDYKALPTRSVKQPDSNYKYASHEFGMSAFVPVYAKQFEHAEQKNNLGIFVTPTLRFSNFNLSYLPSRIFINAGCGVGTYYHFKQKNTLTAILQAQVNEDEFTINNVVLRYGGMLVYNHKSSERFSYYLGTTYTYIFGDGYLLPVIGGRFKMGKTSQLMVALPYHINFTHRFNSKLRLSVSLKPNGGINRYQNRYNFNTNDEVLMMRRRSLVFGTSLYYQLKNNILIGGELAAVLAQKVTFTTQDNSQTFVSNSIANGLQLSLRLIWRPWQNTLRNKEKMAKQKASEYPDDLNDTDILGL